MNGKYILALFVALQVSVSLCEIPAPDPELVAKVEDMKKTLYSRLHAAFAKVQGAAAPYVESAGENVHVQTAKVYADEVKGYPQFQTVVKFFTDLAGDAVPVVEKAQSSALGLYSAYLRPQVGESLDSGIAKIKEYLNVYLPAE